METRKQQIAEDTRRLVTAVTGFQNGEENFDLCLNFAKSNFKYHQFLTPDSHKVERSLDGVCEKLKIHSQCVKAAELKTSVELFLSQPGVETGYHREEGRTDTHYAVLSLLLELAESPTKGQFQRKVKVVETEPVDTFDWGNYLVDAEDRNFVSYASSDSEEDESLSDSDSESDLQDETCGGLLHLATEEQGSCDPTRDTMDKSHEPTLESHDQLVVSGEDEMSQLEKLLVVRYWEGRSREDGTAGDHVTSNLIRDWSAYKRQINEFSPPSAHRVVTEWQICRELVWMLQGVRDLYIFQHHGEEFLLNPDVYLMHLTTESLESSLRPLLRKANQVQTLVSFVRDMVSPAPGQEMGVPQTYQALACCVSETLSQWNKYLVKVEKDLIEQDKLVTLERLTSDLRPWLDKLQAVHGVYISGVARPSHQLHTTDNNCVRATALLNTLHEAVFESDLLLGTDDSGKGELLLNFLIQCSEPILRIASDWVNYGQLIDPQGEFVLHRNRDVKSLDETFWEKAFVSNLDPDHAVTSGDPSLTSTHPATSGQTTTADISKVTVTDLANRTVAVDPAVYPKFFRSFLGEVILTGKSMEMLENLGRMGEAMDTGETGSRRFEKPLSLYDHFVREIKKKLGVSDTPDVNILETDRGDCGGKHRITDSGNLVNKQLMRRGINDTLLHLNFQSLFSESERIYPRGGNKTERKSSCEAVSQSVSRRSLMCQALRVCQDCLHPYVTTRYHLVCSRLLHILRTEHQLEQCIHAMQRYFLMSAGEVMYDFYSTLFLRIQRREEWKETELLEMFLHEVTDLTYPDDSSRLSVELVHPGVAGGQRGDAISVTDVVRLRYRVPWPVDTVIDSQSQDRYNDIFNFLMQIKRAKFTLEQLRFEDLSRDETEPTTNFDLEPDPMSYGVRVHRFQVLRFRLLHFINSLHNYLMTRILHSTGLQLSHDLATARDLEEVIKVHREYVESIHDRCLLHPKLSVLKQAIGQVLALSLTCGAQWRRGAQLLSGESVLELEQELTRCVHFLSIFLNNIIKRGSLPHLESLAFALVSSLPD